MSYRGPASVQACLTANLRGRKAASFLRCFSVFTDACGRGAGRGAASAGSGATAAVLMPTTAASMAPAMPPGLARVEGCRGCPPRYSGRVAGGRHCAHLVLSQPPADSARLLGAQVQGDVLLQQGRAEAHSAGHGHCGRRRRNARRPLLARTPALLPRNEVSVARWQSTLAPAQPADLAGNCCALPPTTARHSRGRPLRLADTEPGTAPPSRTRCTALPGRRCWPVACYGSPCSCTRP